MVCSLRPGQRIHSRFRGIEDKRLAASHGVQKGDIEPHDAEPDYADFVYSINHKMATSPEKNSTLPEIPQAMSQLNVIQRTYRLFALT